tara:strand:- start:173 stop:460 length:288 start_codon:yes stop_codon:yes gene_type:complete
MKIETTTTTIDVFPIRRVRIDSQCDHTATDDIHIVCQEELRVDRVNTIGLNQQQATLILTHMREANTDLMGNGKEFYMVRGNCLVPIQHYSFAKL